MTPFGAPMHDSPFTRSKARKAPRERKPRQDREHAEAVALMQRVKLHEARWPALRWLFAVPNGGWRGKPRKLRSGRTLPPTAATKAKSEGVRRGVPDYLWPVHCVPSRIPDARIVANAVRPPAQYWVGLALELKAKGGRVEPEQREWLLHLESQGWLCVVAYGADEAWAAIREYCDGLPAV